MPECYIDNMLIESLVEPRSGYNHQKGCHTIENELVNREHRRGRFFDDFAVAIIDDDKKKIRYIDDCVLIDFSGDDLKLFKHPEKHHYLIQICPASEHWILKICARNEIRLPDFNLPDDLDGLIRKSKRTTSKLNPDLRALFNKMAQTNSDPAIRKLKHWVDLLLRDNYNVDICKLTEN